MEKIINKITAYKEEMDNMPVNSSAKPVDKKEFTLLLSGISTCRKVPGIPVHMGYEELYHCKSVGETREVLEHLKRLWGITNKEDLMQVCFREYSKGNEYEQFMTFWKGVPLFDVNELNENGKKEFETCKAVAEAFYPLLQEKGICAWDISERIGLCRVAVACGILTEEEFWEATDEWVKRAQVFYHSYQDYALGCLCGAVYFMAKYEASVEDFLEINLNVIKNLFEEGNAWQRNAWYTPEKREWAHLLNENPGCVVTKKLLEQETVGFMRKEEPVKDHPDSGWRFFVGDESDEYLESMDNIEIVGLNAVCNLDPTVMAYIHTTPGKSYRKYGTEWVEE